MIAKKIKYEEHRQPARRMIAKNRKELRVLVTETVRKMYLKRGYVTKGSCRMTKEGYWRVFFDQGCGPYGMDYIDLNGSTVVGLLNEKKSKASKTR